MNPMRFFMHKKRYKYINGGCQGIISIMLCIVMLPFLSMASMLIETYRYQHVIESLEEISELAGVSVLTDYDSYLNDRFGLLAVSQENLSNDIYTEFSSYFEENLGMLGGTVTMKKAQAKAQGGSSLKETFLVEQELLDYCEMNLTVDVTTDLLEEIINKLKGTSAVQNLEKVTESLEKVEKVASAVADITESINNMCDKIDSLQGKANELTTHWESLQTILDENAPDLMEAVGEETTLLQDIADLELKKLSADEDEIGQIEADISAKQEILDKTEEQIDGLLGEVSDVFQEYRDYIEGIKSDVESIGTSITDIQTSFNTLDSLMDDSTSGTSASTSSSKDDDGEAEIEEVTSGAMNAYKVVYEKIKEIVEKNIKEDLQNRYDTVKKSINDILDYSIEDFEEDLKNSVTTTVSLEDFKVTINVDLKGLIENNGVREALNAIITSTTVSKDSVWEKVKTIIESIEDLFKLDVVDDNLNAKIPDSYRVGETSSSQQLLNAFTQLRENTSDLGKYINDGNWGKVAKKIKNIISNIKNIFSTICTSFKNFVSQMINKFKNGLSGLLRLWIISEYMERNLPNRVNYDSETGITGYAYADIPDSGNAYKGAELEYILAGTNSEKESQKDAFMKIYFLRLLLDMPVIFKDKTVSGIADTLRAIPLVGPALSVAIYIVYIIAEPFCDTLLLVNSKAGDDAVKIGIKSNCYLTADGIGGLISDIKKTKLEDKIWGDFGTADDTKSQMNGTLAMTYQQYMLLLIMIHCSEEEIVNHFITMAWVEAEAYYEEKGSSFSMDKACTCIQMDTEVEIETILNTEIMNSLYQVKLTNYRGY